jgi:hypoxanthine phosphoribosyltransferase
VEVCTLLDKPGARRHPVRIRYAGFQVPDVFVVGYGLDLDGVYRNLPHIATIARGRGRGGWTARSAREKKSPK